MLYNILLVFEVLLAIGLVALILLQQGKGADAGAAFGSGASGTVFGARGASNFLSRATAIMATLFFLNCLALAFMISHRGEPDDFRSVVEESGSVIPEEVPPVQLPVDENPVVPEVQETAPGEIPEVPEVPVPAETVPAKPADIPD